MNELETYIYRTRGCVVFPDSDKIKCSSWAHDKFHVYNWMEDKPKPHYEYNVVELRFKNSRKGYYVNSEHLFLKTGELVAVEANPGHDIGIVSLMGEPVYWQLKKLGLDPNGEFPKIYRKARPNDVEKWKNAISRELDVLYRGREIIEELGLKMKLGDVEFQGDGTKATFYYIADERVDFRELIKIYAAEFRIRVEMRQIGARQESGRLGGIGTCGRELCCITWKRTFSSVSTSAARYQELSLNPTKLAGQCGKLKCCLNFELDAYIEARKDFPDTSKPLETMAGTAYYQKADVFKRILWYSSDPENSTNMTPVPIERVEKILEMNKKGQKPDTLLQDTINVVDMIKNKHNIEVDEQQNYQYQSSEKENKKRKKKRHKK